jgi:hypothetical protein
MPARGPVRPGRTNVTWIKLPKAAQVVAARALARQEGLPKSKRGGLSRSAAGKQGITSGRERAASIARGELQPAEDLRDFFNRFRSTFERSADKAWEDSKIQQAWDLWGGEPAREAVQRKLANRSNPGGIRIENTKRRLLAWNPGLGVAFGARHNPIDPPTWMYHVTASANMPSIASRGLVPGSRSSISQTIPADHLDGVVFFTEASGVFFWYSRAEDAMVHTSEDPQGEGYTPVVLRTPFFECDDDPLGSRDSGGHEAYRCDADVEPQWLEFFDGDQWREVTDWDDSYTAKAWDSDGYFDAETPLMPQGNALGQDD